MAGRQFQKLQRLQQQEQQGEVAVDHIDTESEDGEVTASAPFNPFSLLNEEDEDEILCGEEDNDLLQVEELSDALQPGEPAEKPAPSSAASKRKKSKKKKPSQPAADKDTQKDDDIDAILKELNISVVPTQIDSASASTHGANQPLLAVNLKQLRPEEELKRIFGSRLVDEPATDPGGGFAGYGRRVRRLAARGLIRRERLKQGTLITPKEHWPLPDADAHTLKYSGIDSQGRHCFTYQHSATYMAVQALFDQVQSSFDPNALASFLQQQPYHVDALLTMADLYRSTGENAFADEMVERCLYALELAWSPVFLSDAAAGKARMLYEENNIPFFVALFRYAQTLGRRGLHRTALEISKLLLGLNSDDPTGIIMCIDFFAVRAGQYAFLYKFIEEYNARDQSVALMPNMAYSLALAKWYQEKDSSTCNVEFFRGLASWSSKDLLTRAVFLHPLVVTKLQEKVKEAGVSLTPGWQRILNTSFFSNQLPSADSNASLAHLTSLTVEKQFQLWKTGPVQEFLFESCSLATAATETSLPDGLRHSDYAGIREQAFPPSEVNAYRHLRLHEFSDAPARLNPEELHGGQMDAVDIEAQLRAAIQAAGIERVAPEDLQGANPLIALLRSFLPWVAMGEQPEYDQTNFDEHRDDDDGGAE